MNIQNQWAALSTRCALSNDGTIRLMTMIRDGKLVVTKYSDLEINVIIRK